MLVIVMVGFTIIKLSSTYAANNQSYSGNNKVSGKNYALNITDISEPKNSNVQVINEIASYGTNLNFEILLTSFESTYEFEFTVTNNGKSKAMLDMISLSGLNSIDAENIDFKVTPVDNLYVKTDKADGSIIKPNETNRFKVIVGYKNNINDNNFIENDLNLGITIIYEEK